MCGIVGAVSTRNIVPILIEGLKRLEYRGYDSCGVAVHQDGELRRARSTARVAELERQVAADGVAGGTGIAHTRWATHGAPAVHNAHPHFSHGPGRDGQAGIGRAHRAGAQRHHREPRRAARRAAAPRATCSPARPTPRSSRTWSTTSTTATCSTPCSARVPRLRGAYAIAVFCRDEPQRVVGAREGSPLVLGVGTRRARGENFLASDAMALAGVTDQIVYLEEGDVVDLQLGKHWISARDGRRPLPRGAARGAHRARAQRRGRARARTATTCRRRSSSSRRRSPTRSTRCPASRPSCSATARTGVFKEVDSVLILACGTSYYSGSTAQVLAREHREDPDQRRDRERIPLPRQRAEPAHAGRHDHAERRDRRHARRAEARARARHGAHADDLQRRDQRDGARVRAGLHHARRRRDRRRVDQGVHAPSWSACSC